MSTCFRRRDRDCRLIETDGRSCHASLCASLGLEIGNAMTATCVAPEHTANAHCQRTLQMGGDAVAVDARGRSSRFPFMRVPRHVPRGLRSRRTRGVHRHEQRRAALTGKVIGEVDGAAARLLRSGERRECQPSSSAKPRWTARPRLHPCDNGGGRHTFRPIRQRGNRATRSLPRRLCWRAFDRTSVMPVSSVRRFACAMKCTGE